MRSYPCRERRSAFSPIGRGSRGGEESVAYEPGVEASVLDTLRRLQASGFADELRLEGDQVVCGACGLRMHATELEICEVHRFEGESNPDDESIVVALACAACQWRGVLVSAYGPAISPEAARFLRALPTASRPPPPA